MQRGLLFILWAVLASWDVANGQPCPNGCSGHGRCSPTTLTCICGTDYTGYDCSQSQSSYPTHPSYFLCTTFDFWMIMRWHQPLDICRILPICTCDVRCPHCHRRCACKSRVFEYGNGVVTHTYLYIRATSSWILLFKPGILRLSAFVFHRAGYMWQNGRNVHLPSFLRWTCLSKRYLEYIYLKFLHAWNFSTFMFYLMYFALRHI